MGVLAAALAGACTELPPVAPPAEDPLLSHLDASRTEVLRQLDAARAAHDAARALCVNDKLGQLDAVIQSAQRRRGSLDAAGQRGDADQARRDTAALGLLRGRSDLLAAEAGNCVGQQQTAGQGAGTAPSCTEPRVQDCTFYQRCLEARTPCGAKGYALGFGARYCGAFQRVSSHGLTERGSAWVDSVMLCLEKGLVPYVTPASAPVSCDEITRAAFEQHPGCYTQPESSICFLPPPDVLAVFETIGADELFTERTRAQMQAVVATCVVQVGDRAGDAVLDPLDATLELADQVQLWQGLVLKYAAP